MPNVTNKAYYGQAGEVVINGDTHFGVTAISLVPTTPEEVVPDVSGDVQVLTGVPTWRLGITVHQDHITDGSLSRKSPEWAGEVIPVEYTPQAAGEGRTVNVRWKDIDFGGDTGRRSATLDLGVIGQPVIVPPVEPDPEE